PATAGPGQRTAGRPGVLVLSPEAATGDAFEVEPYAPAEVRFHAGHQPEASARDAAVSLADASVGVVQPTSAARPPPRPLPGAASGSRPATGGRSGPGPSPSPRAGPAS